MGPHLRECGGGRAIHHDAAGQPDRGADGHVHAGSHGHRARELSVTEEQHIFIVIGENCSYSPTCIGLFGANSPRIWRIHALPNFSWLAPNGCDDAHDCSIGTFDTWLKTEIRPTPGEQLFSTGGRRLADHHL